MLTIAYRDRCYSVTCKKCGEIGSTDNTHSAIKLTDWHRCK